MRDGEKKGARNRTRLRGLGDGNWPEDYAETEDADDGILQGLGRFLARNGRLFDDRSADLFIIIQREDTAA